METLLLQESLFFFFSDSGVVSLFSQQTVTEKYEFVRSFFVLCFGSSHSRIEVSPPCHPLSVCVFSLFRQQHPSGVPANPQNIKPQISSSVAEKARLIRRLHKLEVLYLSSSPNVCFACALPPSAAPVVKGNCSLSVHARRMHAKVNNSHVFISVCLCGYVSL